jgi:hypothetical protein
MHDAHRTITQRAILLWVGAALVMTLNSVAAVTGSKSLVLAALAVTGLFAFVGVGFGVWVGRTIARSYRMRDIP